MTTPAEEFRTVMKSLDLDIKGAAELLGESEITISCNLIADPPNLGSCGYQLILRWTRILEAAKDLADNPGPCPKPLTLED